MYCPVGCGSWSAGIQTLRCRADAWLSVVGRHASNGAWSAVGVTLQLPFSGAGGGGVIPTMLYRDTYSVTYTYTYLLGLSSSYYV